jgi:2-amino-4-hydroxy-6-hydroxymethyldihydropteridine diphosphokinase
MTDSVRAYIGIGSNVGDRFAHCQAAVDALGRLEQTRLIACSRWFETEPVGGIPQDWFLNGAVAIDTVLGPKELLDQCLCIERNQGRDRARGVPGGPREVDLDILLYGDQVLNMPDLQIPHPRLAERAFVLVPLHDIAPHAVHPVYEATVADLRARLSDHHAVRLFEPVHRSA